MTQPSSLFRSEEMSLVQLYIPTEVSHSTVAELGELGLIQFRDLNPDTNAFQRAYVTEVRRMDEMERRCRFFTTQIEKAGITAQPPAPTTYLSRPRTAQEIDEMGAKLREHEARITQMNTSHEDLQKRHLELVELRYVLRETASFLQEARTHNPRTSIDGDADQGDTAPLLQPDVETGGIPDSTGIGSLNLGYVTGVISRQRLPTFERVLWRSLRGNLYMKHAEIEDHIIDPVTDEEVEKNVFLILSPGRELLNKIRKISESLGATLYNIDPSQDARNQALREATSRMEDLNNVLANTNETRRTELFKVADELTTWMTVVKKEKAIYHTMNLFNYDNNRHGLIAEGWCATNDIPTIKNALKTASEASGASVASILDTLPTTAEPPTYQRTNKFSNGFQVIVDAYGIAKYREVNPGLFTVITFPFLFAVMFGDLGHGFLLFLFGAYLIWKEKDFAKTDYGEMFDMVFGGRYIILLMGLFSIYTGAMYNDIFSQAMEFFPSGWEWPTNITEGVMVEAKQRGVYAFGVDHVWHGSENALLFTNSYKMKMAIILGVIHMSFGIVLNVYNYSYFKKGYSIWAEFLPQFIFMQVLFGYLAVCIVYKWTIDWYETDSEGNNIHNSPPNLLNLLIFMFLTPGSVKPDEQLYSGQATVQALLLGIAVICVPWMLLAKPLYLRREHNKPRMQGYHPASENGARISYEHDGDEENVGGAVVTEGTHEEEFDFSELMIHQSIHTIEFCLECVSNTASYLRLWALSLAHAQLSTVLWDMVLVGALHSTSPLAPVYLVIAFYFWFNLTVNILILMEGLSAFLHALRLHWVEFNGKFYNGTGTPFQPFSFKVVLETSADL